MFDNLALVMFPKATQEEADRIVGLAYLGVFIVILAALCAIPLSFLL